ncbi:RusA family crossover junction endodeoxyribonuclease [Methylobacterium sp. J-026]|uniref:RusA family crossover junction endodeoxyribonuclease n=1 Tax=Methylobacterium sp. J-026 TaxID=2836624 RepID=UPI001FB90754|nr:RusA family crossover junction endodeoxyribonuclease [Methylobacterium sp. J-026]MCJ2133318.1 RusA family crossover junction endodeoxyribonuclease [Methylobacterium sp. J-026]
MAVDLTFPIEFNVPGTPVSLQAKRARSKEAWKEKVRAASRGVVPEGHFATERPVAVTLYYFTALTRTGDIDNIVKPTLDALIRHIYLNDGQVERIVAQKFKPGDVLPFAAPSPILTEALQSPRPLVYIKLSDDPFEDLT